MNVYVHINKYKYIYIRTYSKSSAARCYIVFARDYVYKSIE